MNDVDRADLEALKELMLEKFKGIEQQLDSRDRALELQAEEYERRLSDLNHAHQEALRVQHTYVTGDKWEDRNKHVDEALERSVNRLISLEKSAVTQDYADSLAAAAKRTRTSFFIAFALLGLAALVNFVVNLIQSGVAK